MTTKTLLAAALFALAASANAQHLRPPPDALRVYQTLELQPGATIDFADVTQQAPGPLRGYVFVRFQGELVVIPVYQPTPDGTVWRTAPLPVTK